MNQIKILLFLLSGFFFLHSCTENSIDIDSVTEDSITTSEHDHATRSDYDFINSLDISLEDAYLEEFMFPDGSIEERYRIDGDITMSQDEFNALQAEQNMEISLRQYRTYNLVSSPRTIRVIGFTGGGGNGLTSKMRTSLQWAVDNYNALNTGLNFTLTFGTNYQPFDMVVYRVPNGAVGGIAGFPSGGRPYKWIQIFSGMDSYDRNTIEHVITHEMGHAVGMRHTDWFSRQSCGESGEARNPDGAVGVPGTPSGFDSNSVMLACFGSNEDGEFGFYDRVALEYLY